LQDRQQPVPRAKPLLRSALGREPSCSLQDSGHDVFDRDAFAGRGFGSPPPDAVHGIVCNSLDDLHAIASGCRERPERRLHQSVVCCDGNLRAAVAGSLVDYKRLDRDAAWMVEKSADSSDIDGVATSLLQGPVDLDKEHQITSNRI
jgi:hypothetical protein